MEFLKPGSQLGLSSVDVCVYVCDLMENGGRCRRGTEGIYHPGESFGSKVRIVFSTLH